MTILVTAFEPFGGSAHNASLDTLLSLPDSIGGCGIEKMLLPVVYDVCGDRLREAIAAISDLCAVVCLGQAEGRGMITPEMVAVNIKHAASADNAGQVFSLAPIDEAGPDAYLTTLPISAMVDAMHAIGAPASLSFTAGTYVCNNLLYHALALCKPMGIPAGFIHLPLSYEIAQTEGKAGRVLTVPQSALTSGITAALETLTK